MTSWQLVRTVAGAFILLSLALGIPGSNLLQSGFTKWCLMENIMRKLGARAGS